MNSRRVVLTATFIALAAGGTAACDAPQDEETFYTGPGEVYEVPDDEEYVDEEPVEEDTDEVFYCADEDGEIVEAENCDDDTSAGGLFFLWHSSSYQRGLGPGERLYDGDYFPPGDKASRKAFKLPATGRVTNGTVKTNVVGRGSTGGGSISGGGTSGG
ncbi:hypothetical protein [Actinoplanes couchii]|uniref:Secreted protein n=1 Tax=Actinoplanes couchii TaxID=403638 RepID=A0ABQ3XI91_9ACTN|nr:hypothetical protein [Actinoplanes couchii]MDR6324653.1 hypothetical protein [Actinoplanes couchii]GID58206.1 hypothetical protein Aco03nite_066100 [Actinoplanes couchii]